VNKTQTQRIDAFLYRDIKLQCVKLHLRWRVRRFNGSILVGRGDFFLHDRAWGKMSAQFSTAKRSKMRA
jgi:hypothetical protein